MLRFAKWLAVAAACGVLSACATYDYGYPSSYYGYSAPYYGYSYDYGPSYYDYGYAPYYYGWGPSYYVGPSVGFDFRYRDRDRHRGERRHTGSRNDDRRVSRNATTTAPTVQRRGVTTQSSRGQLPAAPVARAQGGRAERPANRTEPRATLRAEQQ